MSGVWGCNPTLVKWDWLYRKCGSDRLPALVVQLPPSYFRRYLTELCWFTFDWEVYNWDSKSARGGNCTDLNLRRFWIYCYKNTKRMSLLMKRAIFFLELLVCTNKFRSSGKRGLVIWSVICGRKGFRVPTLFFYDHRRSKDGLTLSITIIIIIRRVADTSHGFNELTMTQGTWKLMTLWPWRQSL